MSPEPKKTNPVLKILLVLSFLILVAALIPVKNSKGNDPRQYSANKVTSSVRSLVFCCESYYVDVGVLPASIEDLYAKGYLIRVKDSNKTYPPFEYFELMSDQGLELVGFGYNVGEASKHYNRNFMESVFSSYRDNQLFPSETSYSIPGSVSFYLFEEAPEKDDGFYASRVCRYRNFWYDPKSPSSSHKR